MILDNIGLRVIARETAARIISEHHAQQEARQAQQRARQAEHLARMAELTRRNRASLRGGRPATVGGNALSDLIGQQ